MVEFSQFYSRIPCLTRYWLTITVALSLLARVRVIDAGKLPLWWDHLFNEFEIWRPVTAVFYVPPEHFYFLISNYVLYRYSAKLESREFAGRPEDYLMVLVFNWLCGVGLAYYFSFPLLMSTMVMSVVTIWCQYNKHQIISTRYYFNSMYDLEFKAAYLPWAILVANVMYDHHFYYHWGGYGRYGQTLTPQGTEEFAGILSGYLSYYLLAQYPLDYGVPSPLTAPNFVKELFHGARSYSGSSRRPSPEPRPSRYSYSASSEHPWGRGFTTGARRCATEATANDYSSARTSTDY